MSSVTDLTSAFWNHDDGTDGFRVFRHEVGLPIKVKLQIIHNYLVIKRSEEEKTLLKDDMLNFLRHFQTKIEIIKKSAANLDTENDLMAGVNNIYCSEKDYFFEDFIPKRYFHFF